MSAANVEIVMTVWDYDSDPHAMGDWRDDPRFDQIAEAFTDLFPSLTTDFAGKLVLADD